MNEHDEIPEAPGEPVDEARPWRPPTYQIVEASMEMSAYFLADR